MLNNSKILLLSISLILNVAILSAQKKPYYKDVTLNGKPAKLNLATGEFIVEGKKGTDTIRPAEQNEHLSKEKMDYHFVKAGETLLKLADQYGATLQELKEANNLKTTLIAPGQKLRIRNFDKIEKERLNDIWVVKKGHTLYYISRKENVSIEQIKRLNGLKNSNLSIGQKLYIR